MLMLAIVRPLATMSGNMANGRNVFLKQSGERLTDQADKGEFWTPAGVVKSADKIGTLSRKMPELGITGTVIVSGAGNIIRGEKLKKQKLGGDKADAMGRFATVMNTVMLSSALDEKGVPNQILLTPNMQISDPTLGALKPWDERTAHQAMQGGKIILIAGGTGEDGVTSDNAVVSYAARMRAFYGTSQEAPSVEILKGTQFDGVFDKDPAKFGDVRRYSVIPAAMMLADYDKFCAVDQGSLEQLVEHGMDMRVFADADHDLVHVLHPSNINGAGVGTLVLGREVEAQFADEV